MKNEKHLKWILGLLALGLGVLFAHRAWNLADSDYIAYFHAGARALQGGNLYFDEQTPFKYLPVTSLVFIPLGLLPYTLSRMVFFGLSFSAGIAVYVAIIRRFGWAAAAVILASMLRFHNHDFLNLQVNHLLLGLLMLWWFGRPQRPWISSGAFALLACFKVMPFLVLWPLLVARRWKETGRILAVTAGLLVAPLFWFRDGFGIYREWFQLLGQTEFPAPGGAILQSVQGALWFWLQNFVSPGVFSVLVAVMELSLIGWIGWEAWRRRSPRGSDESLRPVLMAALVLSVVINPLAWKHNYLLLTPALLWFWETGAAGRGMLWAQFLLMTALPGTVAIFSKHWADRSYLTLIGALTVMAGLLRLRAATVDRAGDMKKETAS